MKTYNYIFLACVILIVGISAGIMLWSQPITGDLTRISAYPERWFGWNDPQQNIKPITNSKKESGKKHILVVGDSFSEAGHWQAYLGQQYTFSFIHNGKTTLKWVIEQIEKDKPDAIILERFWKPISYMDPSPPNATTGGHINHSSSVNCSHVK